MGIHYVRRATLATLICLAVGIVLFRLSHWLIAADRGLDITDETMYLLSANSEATWMAPFGWHTKPILRVCGGDIACLRTAGFVVLFSVSLVLTMSVFRVTRRTHQPSAFWSLLNQLFLVTGATLLFYTSFLSRTPSYNWVNAVGILVAAAAHVQLLSSRKHRSGPVPRGLEWLAAAGLLFSAAGKPSSPFLLLLLFCVLCSWALSPRDALVSVGRQVIAVAFLLTLCVAARIWPRDFVTVYQHLLTAPRDPSQLGAAQTPTGAVSAVFQSLGQTVEQALTYALSPRFAPLLLGLALASWLTRRAASRLAHALFIGALLLLVAAVFFRITRPENLFYGSGAVLRAFIALFLAFGVIRAFASGSSETGRRVASASKQGLSQAALFAYLLALPVVFSFGSSNGLEVMFTLFPLPALLALAQLSQGRERLIRAAMQFTLATFVVLVGLLSRSTALESPYRSAPITSEFREVQILGSALLVEQRLSDLIHTMQTDSRAAGFTPGTALVSLDWEWQSFSPLALGATPPATMVTTQYSQLDLFRHNAERFAEPAFLDGAWLTITPTRNVPEHGQKAVKAILAEFESLAQREFPKAYRCIGDYGITQVWRPKMIGEPGDTSCPNRGPYPYFLDQGYVQSR